jgi:Right handed beta helix region
LTAVGPGHPAPVGGDEDVLGSMLPPPLPPSRGTTFYVSPTGSDENPGTESLPWRTVQKAVDTLQAGQRAYVEQGLYEENVVYDPTANHGEYGTADDPITITNAPGHQPVLRPSHTNPRYPLRLKGAYFRFHGFVIEENKSVGDGFVNVYITHADNGAAAHHLELSGCEVRFARVASGLFVDHTAHHVQILGNRVHDNNELGVQHQAIYLESDDSLIANNITYNQTGGFGIQIRTDASTGPRGVIVASNTTANNSLAGIVLEHTAIDTKIVNNITAYNQGSGVLGFLSPDHLKDPIGTGNEAWNNMAYRNNPNFRTMHPEIIVFRENFVEDPLFVNPFYRDYHLQFGSPARGRAIAEWTPKTNIEDEPRTIPPDLGAY